jgi:solute:Na+ symporter, SSS family
VSFYRLVRPQVSGWKPIAALAPEVPETRDLARNLRCWILGCAMVYGALFGAGKLLLHDWSAGALLCVLAVVCAWLISRELNQAAALETEPTQVGLASHRQK